MLVSVIIPSYNHEKYIEDAVMSVLRQTYCNIELIVIDDGSSDSSMTIVGNIADYRMHAHAHSNRGAHATINRGLGMASGDYIAILNSDDLFHEDRIKICIDYLNRHDLDLVSTWIETIDEFGLPKGTKRAWHNMRPRWTNNEAVRGFWDTDSYKANLISSNFISTTSNIVMRRSVAEGNGGMRNLRFSHDWDFLLRAAARYRCAVIPAPLLRYRIHAKNTISSDKRWMLFETCWVLAANMHLYQAEMFPPEISGDELVARCVLAGNSIRVKGCEKLYPVLRAFIDSRSSIDGESGPEAPLYDAKLREAFCRLVDI